MLWLILSLSARAETFTLDNGSKVVGLLADYNMRGSCQISVTDGPYSGAILTVPCERIVRFEREVASPAAVVIEAPVLEPEPIVEEVVITEPEPAPVPLAQPVDAPFATEDAHAPAPAPAAEVASNDAPAVEEDGALWSEEAPAPEAQAQAPAAEPTRPAIGGVVLPQLPNLRMMRRPAEDEAEGGEEL